MPMPDVPAPGRYRHFKGGLYNVIGIATHTETNEQLVVYTSETYNTLYVRPLAMFIETVNDPLNPSDQISRFQCLDAADAPAASTGEVER